MTVSVAKSIFKAIHEGKWLSIEYCNKEGETTRYWVAVKGVDVPRKMLVVDGLHLGILALKEGMRIFVDSIRSATVVEGSYCETNQALVRDIAENPERYAGLFGKVVNVKVLSYLADCSKLDATPYCCDYALIDHLDGESVAGGLCPLDDDQFKKIVHTFHKESLAQAKASGRPPKLKSLCLNVLSVNTKRGLHVLAYRRLNLDVKRRALVAADDITVCREFEVGGTRDEEGRSGVSVRKRESIRRYLDADEMGLLDDFSRNAERIKDCIAAGGKGAIKVDDMPYLLALGIDCSIDLEREYQGITDMVQQDSLTVPLRAFFGELVKVPARRKTYPLVLVDRKVNLDQLLTIHHAIRQPVTYVQGPPGTGKTSTIINTILSAFFNNKTVLMASYNNHPVDGVCRALRELKYRGWSIPFPVLRLGNGDKVAATLDEVKELYERQKSVEVFERTLERNREQRTERSRKLTELLKAYEETLDLRERREAVEKLIESSQDFTLQVDLQGKQLNEIDERLAAIGKISETDALALLDLDEADLMKYLNFISIGYIKRLEEPKYRDFLDILNMQDKEERTKEFNRYLSNQANLEKLMRVFPVMATTCLSARRLADPRPSFDLVIVDEASQCDSASSLVPIVRGKNLMLVGDPQQLNPVILLDERANERLRRAYGIADEYDYVANSIYKTFLACDSVSKEILLSKHYRCDRRIIDFNNKKYYGGRLQVCSEPRQGDRALRFIDVRDDTATVKNTAPREAEAVIEYACVRLDKKVGVITPFANQREYLQRRLREQGLTNVTCGTVHAFQGDEKDIILFSLGLTEQTHRKTYEWLKNNKELINVATSRAKDELVLVSSTAVLEKLHDESAEDDLYELARYVKSNGETEVTRKAVTSRALGVKPYSTETEAAFLASINHALGNIAKTKSRYLVRREVPIAQVFVDNPTYASLFYSGRFDFVIYEKLVDGREMPVFAIELDGKEHVDDEVVRRRDAQKNGICRKHGFELVRIENSYARRYSYMKSILIEYFTGRF